MHLCALPASVVLCLLALSCSASRPAGLGVTDGRLAPCPNSPNCVSTQAERESQRMPPLVYRGTREEARRRLLRVIESLPRTKIVANEPDYLAVEFRSRIFRFVDDVEFLFDDRERVIHFRSASRIGYSDLGANRSRMEGIARAFAAAE
jgi:uncharacterized protein (DUF1499 family)